jgi:hypothetical protein
MEKTYRLTLDISDPDVPFKVERSIYSESRNMAQTFSLFSIELIRLLRELHDKELLERQMQNDDIPF